MKAYSKKWKREYEMSTGGTKNQEDRGEFRRFKIVNGPNRVRIVEDYFAAYKVHYFMGIDDKGNPQKRRVNCIRENCPLCEQFQKTGNRDFKWRKRYSFNIISRRKQKKDKKTIIYCLEVGKMIFDQLASYRNTEDYGTLTNYDIVIKKSGTSWKDTKYYVIPCPEKIPFTNEEKEAIKKRTEKGGPYNLKEFEELKTRKEILEIMGEEN